MNAANILSREYMSREAIAWEKMQLEGWDFFGPNGDRRHVYGAQEWELIGDAQRRNGFSAVVQVGVDENGRPMWRSVRFTGTQEHDLLRDHEARDFEKGENELSRQLRIVLEDMATERGVTLQTLQWHLQNEPNLIRRR